MSRRFPSGLLQQIQKIQTACSSASGQQYVRRRKLHCDTAVSEMLETRRLPARSTPNEISGCMRFSDHSKSRSRGRETSEGDARSSLAPVEMVPIFSGSSALSRRAFLLPVTHADQANFFPSPGLPRWFTGFCTMQVVPEIETGVGQRP